MKEDGEISMKWERLPDKLNDGSCPVAEAGLETAPKKSASLPKHKFEELYTTSNSTYSSISDIKLGSAPSTTASPVNDIAQKEDLFAKILLKDRGLQNLLWDSYHELGSDNFTSILEGLLMRMSLSLNESSSEKNERDTSKFVHRHAGGLASIIQSKIDTQAPSKQKRNPNSLHEQLKGDPEINKWLAGTTQDGPYEDREPT